MKQNEGVCLFTSTIKDQTAKVKSLVINCLSLLDLNFDRFSSAKLFQQRISRPHGDMKKIYNFLGKSEQEKFILS